MESNAVYYRVYMTNDGPTVVTMQWFDEFDYDETRFLDPRKFETEAEAEAVAQALRQPADPVAEARALLAKHAAWTGWASDNPANWDLFRQGMALLSDLADECDKLLAERDEYKRYYDMMMNMRNEARKAWGYKP